ncbi:MAG: TolC family protein, partial [Planctomycetaceae bacterium]
LMAATNRAQQARVDVEAACRARVPDLRVYSALQHDATTPPIQRTTFNVQVGIPVPLFDLNRGNIQKAQADLAKAARESERVRNGLRQQLADAWQRYETARIQVAAYRGEILPDQARAYLGFVKSHDQAGGASYTDIVVAQQNLSQALTPTSPPSPTSGTPGPTSCSCCRSRIWPGGTRAKHSPLLPLPRQVCHCLRSPRRSRRKQRVCRIQVLCRSRRS